MAGASKTDVRLEAEAGLRNAPLPSSSMSIEASAVRSATLREVAGMKSSQDPPPPKPELLEAELRQALTTSDTEPPRRICGFTCSAVGMGVMVGSTGWAGRGGGGWGTIYYQLPTTDLEGRGIARFLGLGGHGQRGAHPRLARCSVERRPLRLAGRRGLGLGSL